MLPAVVRSSEYLLSSSPSEFGFLLFLLVGLHGSMKGRVYFCHWRGGYFDGLQWIEWLGVGVGARELNGTADCKRKGIG